MGLNKTVVILRVGSSGLMFQHRMAWKGSRSATCWTIQHYSSIIWCFEPFFFFPFGIWDWPSFNAEVVLAWDIIIIPSERGCYTVIS